MQTCVGPNRRSTVLAYYNLAFALQSKGEYSESAKIYRRALESGENLYKSPDHPMILEVRSQLAWVLHL